MVIGLIVWCCFVVVGFFFFSFFFSLDFLNHLQLPKQKEHRTEGLYYYTIVYRLIHGIFRPLFILYSFWYHVWHISWLYIQQLVWYTLQPTHPKHESCRNSLVNYDKDFLYIHPVNMSALIVHCPLRAFTISHSLPQSWRAWMFTFSRSIPPPPSPLTQPFLL